MARRVSGLLAVAALVAVGVAWGPGAVSVLGFYLAIAVAVVVGADVGGAWIRDMSRRRFDWDD